MNGDEPMITRAPIQYKDVVLPVYDTHCGDKTVVRSSYLHNGISYSGKMASLYWFSPQGLWRYMASPYHNELKFHLSVKFWQTILISILQMPLPSPCIILIVAWLPFQPFTLHMVCNSMPYVVCCVPDPQVMSSLGTWAGLPPQRLPSRAGQTNNTSRPRKMADILQMAFSNVIF